MADILQSKRIVAGTALYVTKLKFEKGNAELRISFDANNAITGIWFISVGDHSQGELEQAARHIVVQLVAHQFQDVFNAFAETIRNGNSAEQLEYAWNQVITSKGAFVSVLVAEKSTEADFVDVKCRFGNGDIIVRVSFAPSMELVGVNLLPAS